MVIRHLICSSVTFEEPGEGVNLHYKCPLCGAELQANISLDNIAENGNIDFNNKISFTIPPHVAANNQPCSFFDEKVELFLALHRDEYCIKVCVQKSDAEGALGIPENWRGMP